MDKDMLYRCVECSRELIAKRYSESFERVCSKCGGHMKPIRAVVSEKSKNTVTVGIEMVGYEKMKGQLRNLEATFDRILEKQERVSKGLNTKGKDITINESNEAYIKAVKCWLRKQAVDRKRNIQDIAMTKEQMILDDEVTRMAIIDFNAWAKENGAKEYK